MTVRCKTGKTGYLKGQAKRIAELRSRAKNYPPGNVYYCEKCTYWHVTKQNRKQVSNNTWRKIRKRP